MAPNKIDQVRYEAQTVLVQQNEVKIAFWKPRGQTKWLATEGLNGCTGVAIISPYAGILAHISPVPSMASSSTGRNDPGQENLFAKLQLVISLYNTYKPFFTSSEGYIVAAVFRGTHALPQAIQTARAVLGRIGVQPAVHNYDVLAPGTTRASGQTSIVIEAGALGAMPKIFVNDVAIN